MSDDVQAPAVAGPSAGVTGVRAIQWVDDALRECLPPGVPPSYRSISAARFTKASKRAAEADVTMFDGQAGRVRVWEISGLRAHHWVSTGDSPLSFEGNRWRRIDPMTLEPLPDQPDLFAA